MTFGAERAVFKLLSTDEPLHIDALAARASFPSGTVGVLLGRRCANSSANYRQSFCSQNLRRKQYRER